MLKLCLQLLVCLTLGLRALALFGHLRRLWMADALAGQFRRELRRRGLLMRPPTRLSGVVTAHRPGGARHE